MTEDITILQSWALSENAVTVTDCDKVSPLLPTKCRVSKINQRINSQPDMHADIMIRPQIANSMVGRSKKVHTQMRANSP